MIESAIALCLVTALAGTAAVVVNGSSRVVQTAHDELLAGRAASSRLEVLTAQPDALVVGEAAFALHDDAARVLHGARGTQVVTRRDDGLLDVQVRIEWGPDGRRVALRTLVAQEIVR